MSEQKKNGKKIAIIVASVLVILAIIAAAVVLLLKGSGYTGPKDPDGNPLYPKASEVTSVEYLHRPGLDGKTGLSIVEKDLTDPAGIEAFLEGLGAVTLKDPTDTDREEIDYAGDVEMFTFKRDGDKGDVTLLIMGKSLSINNDYGSYFYMMEGFDQKALTKDFEEIDLSSKLASQEDNASTTKK